MIGGRRRDPVSELLSVEEMSRADKAAIAGGVPGLDLMEAAGAAVAGEIRERFSKRPVAVLCGPGNNGGDGFVAARLLDEAGWPVRVSLLGSVDDLGGDAAAAAGRWDGEVETLGLPGECRLVVDALFGAGLSRPLEGAARTAIEGVNERVQAGAIECVAIDMPSGVHGDTGEILGAAPKACLTVTFFRPKPGHLLFPGRLRTGDLVVADIGIPDAVLADIRPMTHANSPDLWLHRYPWPQAAGNKFDRGHAVIAGGAEMTGAARLAAFAARRIGAGLVTLAVPAAAFPIYAAGAPGVIVKPLAAETAGDEEFQAYLSDPRRNASLVGPGLGLDSVARGRVLTALKSGKTTILDADALSVFEDDPQILFSAITGPCLLTPHEGEFRRLFSGTGDKLSRARDAARRSGAVVLLKGPDTVIAAPGGRAVINSGAPPELATAGSGDVLAGFVLGLIAQGMDVFDAACAAAWLHGRAAAAFGPGLIAEDLPDMVLDQVRRLRQLSGDAQTPPEVP
jgi:NAD(P)H-hydrate epimerase